MLNANFYILYLEDRVEDSEEETRIRNKTTFQKRPLTKSGGKLKSAKNRRDLLVIKVPHDMGSSDIEVVRPGRHRQYSTSSQEDSSQEVQRPRPKSRYLIYKQIASFNEHFYYLLIATFSKVKTKKGSQLAKSKREYVTVF